MCDDCPDVPAVPLHYLALYLLNSKRSVAVFLQVNNCTCLLKQVRKITQGWSLLLLGTLSSMETRTSDLLPSYRSNI